MWEKNNIQCTFHTNYNPSEYNEHKKMIKYVNSVHLNSY